MDQTTWVINVLDDSSKRSIKYENRFWLRQHVKEMNIRICTEDCEVSIEEIVNQCRKGGTSIIQSGKEIESIDYFRKDKEALVLLKGEGMYFVFLYSPKK